MGSDLILGIALWSLVLAVFFPREWALKLYAIVRRRK